MKKRLTGALAIIIAFCVAFSGLPFLAGNLEANALAKKKKLPKKITLQAAVSGQTQAVLKWNKIKSPSKGYAVFRDGKPVKYFNTKKTAFTDNTLEAGTSYTYQIKTYTKKKVKMWFNKKTMKWQKKKPAKKYRGKSKKQVVYSYKKKSNAVTIRTAAAPAPVTPSTPSEPTDTGDSTGGNDNTGDNTGNQGDISSSDSEQKTYTITWKNWDGTALDTLSVREGTRPVYTKGTPTRPADDNYVYTFKGWDPPMQAVTSDTAYVAQYTAEEKVPDAKYYTVTWKNYNDAVLDEQSVMEGQTPDYSGSTPTRPATTEYTYAFSGWSPEVSAVTADVTFKAQFKETRKTYTITWVVNGKSSTTTVNAGDIPAYNGTPTKPTANGKSYEFTGWSPTPVAATGNKTYTAQFSETSVSPLGYTYKIHILTEPYGNAGTERILIPVYIETNNPDLWNYNYTIEDVNGNTIDFASLYTYYNETDGKSKHIDFDEKTISTGFIDLMYTSYSGKATFKITERDNSGKRNVVASRQVTIKDYKTEEQAWIQSVINDVTDSSMTNSEKMYAICNYILNSQGLNFKYTKYDKNSTTGYLNVLADEGKPYWVTRRANSYISPTFLVKFGTALGYPLHNCYYDYEEGSDMWRTFHAYAYSEADSLYFEACPEERTGATDVSTIEQIDLNTYHFWGE